MLIGVSSSNSKLYLLFVLKKSVLAAPNQVVKKGGYSGTIYTWVLDMTFADEEGFH